MTAGAAPDRCIDAVGAEAHAFGTASTRDGRGEGDADAGDRPPARAARGDHVLPQGRDGLVPGVYVGVGDKIPLGALMNKG
jgi:hypothetical protein